MVFGYQANAISTAIEESYGHAGEFFHLFSRPRLSSRNEQHLLCFVQPKREAVRKVVPNALAVSSENISAEPAPVKVRETKVYVNQTPLLPMIIPKQEKSALVSELDWDLSMEYDPMKPNDYDKITKRTYIRI